MRHPLYETCYTFVMGRMSEGEQKRFVDHLEICPKCVEECDELHSDRAWAERTLRTPRPVWSAKRIARYRRMQQASFMGAACVIVLVGIMMPRPLLHHLPEAVTDVRNISYPVRHKAHSLESDVRDHFNLMRREIFGDLLKVHRL